jgi:uncharacterized protein (TIGR03032 family)
VAVKRPAIGGLRARHHAEWRDPASIASQWAVAGEIDPRLLRTVTRGAWWDTVAALGITLFVTREYEHLLVALRATKSAPAVTYMRLPHPSGLAVDAARGIVHVACTRNPNQVYDFMPVTALGTQNGRGPALAERPLVPVRVRFLPGSLYLHDLALVGGVLHANAVGQNAVVRLAAAASYTRVWWPRCIESRGGPVFARNHIQLNSIAAGSDLAGSYFSASADTMSARRPGHRNFPVDGRGVVFSGRTREPVARGLTRPHSARLAQGRLWVDNSGYGEVGVVEDGRFEPVARLPGWTRGLAVREGVAFVGTSRVLPRFRHYAPGVSLARSRCAVHALDVRTGRILGSLEWPYGNQIFAVEAAPARLTTGFPFRGTGRRARDRERQLFSTFVTGPVRRGHS